MIPGCDVLLALEVLNGARKGQRIAIPGGVTAVFGRGAAADIQFDGDPYISSRHVLFDTTSRCRIKDLGGANVLHINGAPTRERELTDGDILELGYTRFRICLVTTEDALCTVCGVSIGAASNSDGRADELRGVVSYVCSDHVPMEDEHAGLEIRQYRVCRKLGEGGMGIVYKAYDTSTSRLVALKQLKDLTNVDLIRRFHREVAELRGFDHPHIVRFIDSDLDSFGAPFLVTEYVSAGDLSAFVQQSNGRLAEETAVSIIHCVLSGLAYVHSRGDIHRDIKPQNILLSPSTHTHEPSRSYIPKLTDFGLVKPYLRAGGARITKPGEASGSLPFMAPEQLAQFANLDPAADVYSAAATLYYILTGTFVVDVQPDATEAEFLSAILYGRRVPIRERITGISPRVCDAIDRGCRVEAVHRFKTAMELAAALT